MQTKKTKWDEKREASYLTLLDSATRQFHTRGYAATRVEDIVADTGYTHGAFYFHFKNKADCFWHAIELRQQQRGDWPKLLDGLEPETTPIREILTRVFARFDETQGGMHDWLLVMVDFRYQHRDDPDARERFKTVYEQWRSEIARFVAALQQGGWVAGDRDPDFLALELFAATQGLQTHAALYEIDQAVMQSAIIDVVARILERASNTAEDC